MKRALVLCFAALLSGCVFSVDEPLLLRAQTEKRYTDAPGQAGNRVLNEAVLADMKIIIRRGEEEERPRLAIEHGALPFGEEELAWTTFSVPTEGRTQVIYCGGSKHQRWRDAGAIAIRSLMIGDVFVYDYPGFGDSGGRASVADFDRAAEVVGTHVRERFAGKRRIYWGYSLGTFSCAQMAARDPGAAALVLEAPVRNVRDAVAAHDRGLKGLLIRPRIDPVFETYDVAEMLDGLGAPVLILAGERDRILPAHLAEALAEELDARGLDVTLQVTEGAGHFDILTPDEAVRDLFEFFVTRDIMLLEEGFLISLKIEGTVVQ